MKMTSACLYSEESLSINYDAISNACYFILLYIRTSFLFLVGRCSPVNSHCPEAVTSFPPNIVNYSTELSKKLLLDADDVITLRPRKLQSSKKWSAAVWKVSCTSLYCKFFLASIADLNV